MTSEIVPRIGDRTATRRSETNRPALQYEVAMAALGKVAPATWLKYTGSTAAKIVVAKAEFAQSYIVQAQIRRLYSGSLTSSKAPTEAVAMLSSSIDFWKWIGIL